MSEEKKDQLNKTKSLDELFAKKKTSSNADENDNMRSKMNRLKKANSVFDDTRTDLDLDSLAKLEEEKKIIEKNLNEASKNLKKLYALKYQDLKVIDKKNNALSKDMFKCLENANGEGLEKAKSEIEDLKNKIKENEEEIKRISEEKKKLDEYIQGMQTALTSVNEEKQANDREINNINEALNKSLEEKEANMTAIASLNEEIEKLNKEKEAYALKDKELESLNLQLEKAIASKEKQVEKNNALTVKNKELSEELKNLKQDNKNIQKNLAKIEKERDKAVEQLNELNLLFSSSEEKNKTLEEEVKNLNALKDELEKKNSTLLDVTSGLSSEFRNYEIKEVNDREESKKKDELLASTLALNEELTKKLEEVKGKDSPDLSQKIDDLIEQLDSKDFEISQLNDENKELSAKNEIIPELNERIKELEKELKEKESDFNDFKRLYENDDTAIEQSVYNELKEIQAECDQAVTILEEVKKEKDELERELEIAYRALKDQEEILDDQQEILETQQLVIDKKMDDYLEKERKFITKQKEFEQEKLEYDKDRREYEDYKSISSARQDDIFKNENELDNLVKELEEAKADINFLTGENNKLKEEVAKNEEVLSQYLEDIHSSEAKIEDLNDILSAKEKDIEKYTTELSALENEYNSYKEDRESSYNSLKEEVEKLRLELANISADNEKLSIAKFNESRLQSRIYELENNIKVLNLKQESGDETNIANSLEQYRSLLANERDAHQESEGRLSSELNDLKNDFDEVSEKLERFSTNYYYNALSKQINAVNGIIDDAKNSNLDVNRDLYTKYYEDVLRLNKEQNSLFTKEIEKRNEVLSNIKNEKQQELQELSSEPDCDSVNSFTYNKIRLLYKQIGDIDLLLNNQIRITDPLSIESVEEEIIKSYKKKIINYHRQIEANIKNLEKSFNEKYENIQSIDKLISTYDKDCSEMAKGYAGEIAKLNEENKIDDNPLSKIIREEKILLLTNEFQTLINLRDKKYNEELDKLSKAKKALAQDSYNSSLVSYDAVKQNLEDKINQLETESKTALNLIGEEKKHINDDINHLTDQLNQLNSFGDDQIVDEDRRKVKVLLAGKQERLDYLTNIKSVETEKHYNELLTKLKSEYNDVLEDIESTKSLYEKRSFELAESRKIKESAVDSKTRIAIYEEINSYLLSLDNIDDVFNEVTRNREIALGEVNSAKERGIENNISATKLTEKYNSLWSLYDKYVMAKKTMEEDLEDVRTYISIKLEASGTYRKYISYQKTISDLEDKISMGLDKEKGSELLKINNARSNTLKNKVDYLNNEASKLLKNQSVNEYVELTNKIDEIISLIKKMENEFAKYIK